MIALITIFYLSFILMGLMLWEKKLELSNGRKYFFTRLAEGSDHIFEKLGADIRTAVSYFNKHTFIAFLQWIAVGVLTSLRNLYIRLFHLARRHPHAKKVIDMVRGEGEANRNGGTSFFLKKISDGTAGTTGSLDSMQK